MLVNWLIGGIILVFGLVFDFYGLYWYQKIAKSAEKEVIKLRSVQENADKKGAIIEELTKFMEFFSKLSAPVQFAVLGSFHIAIGLYLIIKKPLV